MKLTASLSTLAISALSSMAFAQTYESTVEVHECQPPVNVGTGLEMQCSVSNNGTEAMAEISGAAIFAEPGRTVPWGRVDFSLPVPGGIEPGETRPIVFPHPDVRNLPIGEDSALRLEGIEGRTLDGAILAKMDESVAPEQPMRPVDKREAAMSQLQKGVERCWIGHALENLPSVVLTVEFDDEARISSDAINRPMGARPAGTTSDRIDTMIKEATKALLRCNGNYATDPLPASAAMMFTTGSVMVLELNPAE